MDTELALVLGLVSESFSCVAERSMVHMHPKGAQSPFNRREGYVNGEMSDYVKVFFEI